MSFLAPYFLIGALAVAGPILFHLIRRVVRERMPFSSLMFLRPTPPQVTRRRKLDNLLLLLLRCLCLLLLATAFARPFFLREDTMPAAAGENRQVVLLVDTSASMRRDGVWDKASAMAARYLEKTLPGDQIAVVTFDRQPHTLVSFTEWSAWAVGERAALARQRLTAVSPGWMGTQLGLAMTSAAEQFVDDSANGKPASRRELVLISDLQEGAKVDGLQGHEWPSGMKVIVEREDAKAQANAGLEFLSEAGASQMDEKGIRVRVVNARDSDREKFQLNWILPNNAGPASEPMEIYLPPGQTRNFTAPKFAPNSLATTLCLIGDEVAFDNKSYFAAPEVEHLRIAWFGLESANDPERLRYYAQHVFPGTPRRQVEIIPPTVHTVFSPELLNQAMFAVIPSRLAPEEITAMRDWLTRGKTALLVLTDAQMGPTLAALTGLHEIQVTEAGGDYALLGGIDFTHPVFAPFADPRFSDFTHIHFWKHRRLEIPATAPVRVLAKFDDGSPALTQITVGKGNLLVLASGWNPSDSQFAVSSKFPPFMQMLLDWSGAAAPSRFQFLTGDAIPSPGSAGVSPASPFASASTELAGGTPALPGNVQWQKPDGKKETLAAGTPFTGTDLPGIYVATYGSKERHFAVNLPLDESRTAPMSPDELARLGVPLQTPTEFPVVKTPAQQHHLQQAELENRQKIWRWLIVGALLVTFGEIILSGWLARRVKTAEGSA
jgi:Mg-chelatase subunit ChlD